MSDGVQLMLNEDGKAEIYDDTWDIVIHCENEKEFNEAREKILSMNWIPVTERLPENGEQVLVYARNVHYALAKYDEMREAGGTYKKQWVTFDAWKPFYTIKEVIAWMPLPKWEGDAE